MTSETKLPQRFRKVSPEERRKMLSQAFNLTDEDISLLSGKIDLSELADVLVETAIGTFPVPFGIATGFRIDGSDHIIPMATEEPSVIAAASHAAMIIKSGGGFKSWADDSLVSAQIFLLNPPADAEQMIQQAEGKIHNLINTLIPNMVKRGGGYRGVGFEKSSDSNCLCVTIDLDVKDAMGANVANTCAEGVKKLLVELTGANALMAILTNASEKRKAGASFATPAKYFRKGALCGEDVCQKIVQASKVAHAFPKRAITHNKGVMNGISAVTLATGNDTRAIEAAAHFHAQRTGKYKPLTSYKYKDGHLTGEIVLPLPMGTCGGSTNIWPTSKLSLKLLGNPDARALCELTASVGLAQNLAALFALVTDGIQSGHMRLHAARAAYMAGAKSGKNGTG